MSIHDAWTTNDVKYILTNPRFCLSKGAPWMSDPAGGRIFTEEEWIEVGELLIADIGARQYLRMLLDNLKEEYSREAEA